MISLIGEGGHEHFRAVLRDTFNNKLGITEEEMDSRISIYLFIFYLETFLKQMLISTGSTYIIDPHVHNTLETLFEDSMFPTKVKILKQDLSAESVKELKPFIDLLGRLHEVRNAIAHNRKAVQYKGKTILSAEGFSEFAKELFHIARSIPQQ